MPDLAAHEVLRLLAAVAEGSWNGDLANHTSADEAGHILARQRGVGQPERGEAQRVGSKLAALERRGFVESKREEWGKLWRLAPRVRRLLEEGLA